MWSKSGPMFCSLSVNFDNCVILLIWMFIQSKRTVSTIFKTGPGFSKHYTQLAQPHTQLVEHLRSFAKWNNCKNYTLIYQNHILIPYETHTHFLWLNSVWASYTLLLLTFNTFSNSTSQRSEYCKWSTQRTCKYTINSPTTTQHQSCRLMKLWFISLHIPKSVNMSTWRITTKHVPVFMLLQICA